MATIGLYLAALVPFGVAVYLVTRRVMEGRGREHVMAEPTASPPALLLASKGLLSKWGFNDGDAPGDWLDWCEERGIDWLALPSWREEILPALVCRFLVPVLDQDVTLAFIGTNHNPVRAGTVDGVDTEDRWYDAHDRGPVLTPEWVEVTMEQVLGVTRRVMEGRDRE